MRGQPRDDLHVAQLLHAKANVLSSAGRVDEAGTCIAEASAVHPYAKHPHHLQAGGKYPRCNLCKMDIIAPEESMRRAECDHDEGSSCYRVVSGARRRKGLPTGFFHAS